MLLVEPLVDREVLVLAVEQSVGDVKTEVFHEDADVDLLQHGKAVWQIFSAGEPWTLPAPHLTLEAHGEEDDDGVVEHALGKTFDALVFKVLVIVLPWPRTCSALKLLEKWKFSPVN